jgi:hypothetical protein
VPEDIKTRLLTLHEDNVVIKEQLKTTQDKLAKARQVRDTAKNCCCSLSLAFSLSSLRISFSRKSKPSLVAVRR